MNETLIINTEMHNRTSSSLLQKPKKLTNLWKVIHTGICFMFIFTATNPC